MLTQANVNPFLHSNCDFSQQKADLICKLVMHGYTLTDICKAAQAYHNWREEFGEEPFPNSDLADALVQEVAGWDLPRKVGTFIEWCSRSPKIEVAYLRAKSYGAELMHEQTLEIAEKASNDLYVDGEGKAQINGFAIKRAELMIKTRQWIMERNAPKRFGALLKMDITNSDGSLTLPPEERERRIRAILDGAAARTIEHEAVSNTSGQPGGPQVGSGQGADLLLTKNGPPKPPSSSPKVLGELPEPAAKVLGELPNPPIAPKPKAQSPKPKAQTKTDLQKIIDDLC